VEILKQPQFKPMHVIDQVIVIYAAANGFVDAVPVPKVREWEERLLAYVHENQRDFFDRFAASKDLTKENEADLRRVLQQFTDAYVAGRAADPR